MIKNYYKEIIVANRIFEMKKYKTTKLESS